MYYLIAAVVFVVFMLAVFWRRLQSSSTHVHTADSIYSLLPTLVVPSKNARAPPPSLCDKPNCVRCNRNVATLAQASEQFKSVFADDESLRRVRDALFTPDESECVGLE
jgi:hypothetical protein